MKLSIRGWKGDKEALITSNEHAIYLEANGRILPIAPEELYDIITLAMSAHYQDFTAKEPG